MVIVTSLILVQEDTSSCGITKISNAPILHEENPSYYGVNKLGEEQDI